MKLDEIGNGNDIGPPRMFSMPYSELTTSKLMQVVVEKTWLYIAYMAIYSTHGYMQHTCYILVIKNIYINK